MSVHVKKCHPKPFQAMADEWKTFEWRKEDDCTYDVGDILILCEWSPRVTRQVPNYDRWGNEDGVGHEVVDHPGGYTGRVIKRLVTFVLRGEFGMPDGYACLSVRPFEDETSPCWGGGEKHHHMDHDPLRPHNGFQRVKGGR